MILQRSSQNVNSNAGVLLARTEFRITIDIDDRKIAESSMRQFFRAAPALSDDAIRFPKAKSLPHVDTCKGTFNSLYTPSRFVGESPDAVQATFARMSC